jgi:hypothetical protein
MGAIPPQVKKDRPGGNPGDRRQIQSVQRERINLNSLTPSPMRQELSSPLQKLHVYRHVDSEKVECSTSHSGKASKTLASPGVACSPADSVSHGEHFRFGKHAVSKGGVR